MDTHARVCLYQMTQFLSQVFGPTYHFAYYDIEDLSACRTTFSVGEESPHNNISRTELIKQYAMEAPDFQEPFQLAVKSGESACCSHNVFFLKNEDGTLSGLLIVTDNCEAKLKLLAEIEAALNIKASEPRTPVLPVDSGLTTVSLSSLQPLVQELLDEMDIEGKENLMPIQKTKIIAELRKRGAFKLKGAVPLVAQLLNTSIPTIYRYLNKLDPLVTFDGDFHGESIRLL